MTIKAEGSDEAIRREKAALRAQFRAFRQEMPEEEWAARCAAIAHQLASLPEIQHASTIHSFWPLVARREIDVRPLLHQWHAAGKTIVLPRVAGLDPPRLSHHVWHPEAVFARSTWGVDEPDESWLICDPAPAVILVPALVVDAGGYRLGYGKGFYDAFLAETAALRIVPVYDEVVVRALPREAHDVPTDVVVTETRVLRFG